MDRNELIARNTASAKKQVAADRARSGRVQAFAAFGLMMALVAGVATAESFWGRGKGTGAGAAAVLSGGAAGSDLTLTPGALNVGASGIATDGGVAGKSTTTSMTFTSDTNGTTATTTVGAFEFHPTTALGSNDSVFRITNSASTLGFRCDQEGDCFAGHDFQVTNDFYAGGASLHFSVAAANGSINTDGALAVGTTSVLTGAVTVSSSLNVGAITLSAGTGTATVRAGAICVCQDTSAVPLVVRCSLSSTTLTAAEASGTNVVNYICL